MSLWSVGGPAPERLGNLKTGLIVHHDRPAIRETLGQLAHEHVAHKTRDLLALLRFSKQPAQHLHACDVILAKLFGQLKTYCYGASPMPLPLLRPRVAPP